MGKRINSNAQLNGRFAVLLRFIVFREGKWVGEFNVFI